jgi:ankyrin repeat protein
MNQPKRKLSNGEVEKKVSSILKRARQVPRFRRARERDALIDAICYGDLDGHLDIAKALLVEGVDPNSMEPNGRSPLWHAAFWVRSDLIKDLVNRGAALPDDVLMGPVHAADIEVVRFLVRHGANVNCIATYTRYSRKFPQKRVLLTEAIQAVSRESSMADIFSDQQPAMSSKRRNEDWELIPIMLIKAGAKVNRLAYEYSVSDGYIRTILGLAAHCGLARTVKAMLAAGADVNQQDAWGRNALHDASFEGHRGIAKILLAAGANPKCKSKDGATPVSIARERGFVDLANEIQRHIP